MIRIPLDKMLTPAIQFRLQQPKTPRSQLEGAVLLIDQKQPVTAAKVPKALAAYVLLRPGRPSKGFFLRKLFVYPVPVGTGKLLKFCKRDSVRSRHDEFAVSVDNDLQSSSPFTAANFKRQFINCKHFVHRTSLS